MKTERREEGLESNCDVNLVQCQPQLTPQVTLELEWPFRVVVSWAKMAKPFYSQSNQSSTVGHLVILTAYS